MTILPTVFAPRWLVPTPPPHPTNHIAAALRDGRRPAHADVQAFYRALPDSVVRKAAVSRWARLIEEAFR